MNLSGKVALVTGASRGIGYHICKHLAKAGAHVIALARTIQSLEDLDDEIKTIGQGNATLVPLNLEDTQGIHNLKKAIDERWGKLDIFVANAAILGVISPIAHIEEKVFTQVMNINVITTWHLIRCMEALLHKSTSGRAIILSSHAAHTAPAFWSAYAASKAAVETLTRCWANETKNSMLRINIADPGPVRTQMRAQAMPGENPNTLPHPNDIAEKIIHLASSQVEHHGMIYRVQKNLWESYPD